MCSPSQVLRDVYTEVLEAAHPLHRGPTDHCVIAQILFKLTELDNAITKSNNKMHSAEN